MRVLVVLLLVVPVWPRSLEKKYHGGYSISESRSSESFNAVPVFEERPVAAAVKAEGAADAPSLVRHDFKSDHMGNHQLEYETVDGTAHSSKSFVKTVNGVKVVVQTGTISWTTPDGKKLTLHYVADEKGYRVEGDHLPDQPPDADRTPSAEETKKTSSSYDGYNSYSHKPEVSPSKPSYSNYNYGPSAAATTSKPYSSPAAPPATTPSKPAYGNSYQHGTQVEQKPVASHVIPPLPTLPPMEVPQAPSTSFPPMAPPEQPAVPLPLPTFQPMPQPQPLPTFQPPMPPQQPTFQPLPQPTFPPISQRPPNFPSFTARPPRPAPTTTATTTTSRPFSPEPVDVEPITSIQQGESASSQFAISPGLQGANIIQAPIVPILAGPGSANLLRTFVQSPHLLIDSDHKRTVIRIHEKPV